MNAARIGVNPALAAEVIEGPIVTAGPAHRVSIPKNGDAELPTPETTGTRILPLSELVAPEDILMDMEADQKRVALSRISKALGLRVGKSQGAVLKALLRRELLGPTSIGDGVALPHARLESITRPAAVLARSRHTLVFGATDDDPVDLIMAVLWPEADAKGFVPALASISRLLRSTELGWALRRSKTAGEAHAAIAASEEAGSLPRTARLTSSDAPFFGFAYLSARSNGVMRRTATRRLSRSGLGVFTFSCCSP